MSAMLVHDAPNSEFEFGSIYIIAQHSNLRRRCLFLAVNDPAAQVICSLHSLHCSAFLGAVLIDPF